MTHPSAREIVDAQLAAYNARDIEAYCALFADDAVTSTLATGADVARGLPAIRAFYTKRFTDSPQLHCRIVQRTALGDFVIDHEHITGIGDKPLQCIAIYEVRDGLIRSVRFIWQP